MGVKINNEVVEMMLYFWQASSEGEKTGESFIIDVSNRDEMKLIYDDNFNEESVRKVLSAISNRELLNGGSDEEKRFWNNNMFAMEDMGITNSMVDPIKHLNLDGVDSKYKEIIFVPGHLQEYYDLGDKIVFNFFKISVDVFGGTGDVTVNGKPFEEYIQELLSK
ncbi:MAG: hypothetical protein SPI59_04525 [Finegoldia sp.]|nr:hypothetical protein [Finegoldia sp.]